MTLCPPLAVGMKSCVMKSNAGWVFDAPRKVVAAGWAEAVPAPSPATPGTTTRASPAAPTTTAERELLEHEMPFGEEPHP